MPAYFNRSRVATFAFQSVQWSASIGHGSSARCPFEKLLMKCRRAIRCDGGFSPPLLRDCRPVTRRLRRAARQKRHAALMASELRAAHGGHERHRVPVFAVVDDQSILESHKRGVAHFIGVAVADHPA